MFFKRVFLCVCAVALGLLPAVWLIYNTPPTHHLFAKKLLCMLEETWDAHILIPEVEFNLAHGTIKLCNGKVVPKKLPTCSWEFDQCVLSIDRFSYLTRSIILIDVFFNTIEITSPLQNKTPLILDHFATILLAPDTSPPIYLTSLHAQQIILNAADTNNSYSCTLAGNTSFKKLSFQMHSPWQGNIELNDGQLHINGIDMIQKLAGNLQFTYTPDSNVDLHGNTTLTCQGKTHQSIMTAAVNITNNVGSITIVEVGGGRFNPSIPQDERPKDKALILSPSKGESANPNNAIAHILLKNNETLVQATAPLSKLASFYYHLSPISPIAQLESLLTSTESIVNAYIAIPQHAQSLHGSVDVTSIPGFPLPDTHLEAVWNFHDSSLSTSLHLSSTTCSLARADINWQTKNQQVTCHAHTTSPLKFNQWEIAQASLATNVYQSAEKAFHGTYKAQFTPTKQQKSTWSGNLFVHNNELNIAGTSDHNSYVSRIALQPLSLASLKYAHHAEKVIDINAHPKNKTLQGSISYAFIRSLLPENLQNMLLGTKGILTVTLDQSYYPRISGTLHLKNSKLAIFDSCNMLKSGTSDFSFDIQQRLLTLSHLNLLFYKGSMSSPELTATWNPLWQLSYLHAPCLVEDVLFNWKRDFYGLVYGTLFFEKQKNGPLATTGNLVVKKSLLKENIFAAQLETSLLDQPDWQIPKKDVNKLKLHVQTEQPLHTKTSFLDTDAHFDLNIDFVWPYSRLTSPTTVHGDITLHKGCLQLGKHMLWITSGLIRFVPNQMGETIIDVIARNKIKKYLITLTATGSLQKPTVLLESTPHLNEEQIIALLFSGSENASLQADLPAMLMQNLHKILVGSNITLPQATTWFEKITKPFKYIQISPHFTDQSGRGGIKGTVSVDLNSQLHAQIQKNFNLQEDFSFQLEYYFTDDINVKIIRDQRGDVGSEVEVRMKL